jgi:hypothetical protein
MKGACYEPNTRVKHKPSNRVGVILKALCIGDQVGVGIEVGPYDYFYEVRWNNGLIDKYVSEGDLVKEE